MNLPVNGVITSNFGSRILNGNKEFHKGVDIAVPTGTAVRTLFGGRSVDYSRVDKDSRGIYLVLKSANKEEYFYHLSLLNLKSSYNPGDIIGNSGNSGRSTGAHLHYALKVDGSWVDPLKYLEFRTSTDIEVEDKKSNVESFFTNITSFGFNTLIYLAIIALIIFSILRVYKIDKEVTKWL